MSMSLISVALNTSFSNGFVELVSFKRKTRKQNLIKKPLSFDFMCPYLSNLDKVTKPPPSCVTGVMAAQ